MKIRSNIQDRLYTWAASKVHSRMAPFFLFGIFLLELLLFLPLDPILMLYCVEKPAHRLWYALIATLSSLVAASAGYIIGFCLWQVVGPYILEHVISPSFFAMIESHYEKYEAIAVGVGSLLPLPFKAITLSAGACKLPFAVFLLSVCIGRALRFFSLSHLMYRFGDRIKTWMGKYSSKAALVIGAKAVLTAVVLWVLA